jgi:hypothetical protein
MESHAGSGTIRHRTAKDSGQGHKGNKKRAIDHKSPPCKNVCGHCGGTHPWLEDKCYRKKDTKDGQSGTKSRVSISMTKVSDLKPGNWLVIF